MLPTRRRQHPFEARLQDSLNMRDVGLLWNGRIGIWQVAWYNKAAYQIPGPRLVGAEGCEDPTRPTPWQWVLDCLVFRAVAHREIFVPGEIRNTKPFEPRNPGPWLYRAIKECCPRYWEDLPVAVRNNAAKLADWIEDHNKEITESQWAEDDEAWEHETLMDALHAAKGRVITYGKI